MGLREVSPTTLEGLRWQAPSSLDDVLSNLNTVTLSPEEVVHSAHLAPIHLKQVHGFWLWQTAPVLNAAHAPCQIRLFPFTAVRKGEKWALAVQEHEGCVSENAANPFFEQTGEPTTLVARIQALLADHCKKLEQANKMAHALFDAGALELIEASPELNRADYTARFDSLQSLPEDRLEKLNTSGALGLAYAQALSRNVRVGSPEPQSRAVEPQDAFLSAVMDDLASEEM